MKTIILIAAGVAFALVSRGQGQEKLEFDRFIDSLNVEVLNTREKASEIRKYVAARLVRGNPLSPVDSIYHSIHRTNPWEVFQLMNNGQLQGLCGLAARVMASIFSYAGYNTLVYNCGLNGTVHTHEFTLVQIGDNWLIEDAYYNFTSDLDFFEVLNFAKIGRADDIPLQVDLMHRRILLDSLQVHQILNLDSLQAQSMDKFEFIRHDSSGYHYQLITTMHEVLTYTLPTLAPLLRNAGLPEHYFTLYLLPLSAFYGENGEEAYWFIERVTVHNRKLIEGK